MTSRYDICASAKTMAEIKYTVNACTYALQNDVLGLGNIFLIPFAFNPGEVYCGIEDCKRRNGQIALMNQ